MPPAILTKLEREIASEERIVGIPTDQPLTQAAIVRRRHDQVGVLLGLVALVVVATFATEIAALRVLTSALALAFGVYALRKERHLQRLEVLLRDECSIHLTVADSILRSGALYTDRELLDLRSAVERGASQLADGAADALLAHCAGVRLVGPSGETPLAAVCDFENAGVWLDPAAAHEAVQRHEPIRRGAPDGRTVIAVPLEHQFEVVGVLEVVSGPDEPYGANEAELVVAFARGAVSGLLSGRTSPDTP